MGEAVGKIYVERHFPPEVKARMDVLVANLVEAYRQSIATLEWMGEATRQRALEKLEAFTPKIGYPVEMARLLDVRHRSRRSDRQRAGRERVRVRRASCTRSASRSTATSGS